MGYTIIATLYKLKCQFDWQVKNDDTCTWTFGSLEGVHNFIEEQKKKGLLWYSIEGQEYIPCDENDPKGQLYIGLFYMEFKENKDGRWV